MRSDRRLLALDVLLAAGIGATAYFTQRPQFAVTTTPFVALNLGTGQACSTHPKRWRDLPPCSPQATMSAHEFLDAKGKPTVIDLDAPSSRAIRAA